MEPMAISAPRKLDDLNRVVVPPEVRALLGTGPGGAVVFVVREGRIEVARAPEETGSRRRVSA